MAIQPNPLRRYSSYNTVFTLSVLTAEEINLPDETYRVTNPALTILRSGGGVENKVTTVYEDAIGAKLEYFINNVEIDAIIAPTGKTRVTNATNITMNVQEPYSMGLFLQTLHIAATQAGYTNYIQAPFLLTVEFIGWDDNGQAVSIEEQNYKRMIPLKFTNIEFDIGNNGTSYEIQAIPWNEQANIDQVEMAKTDINISGATVADILQNGENSLTTVINGRYEELRNENKLKSSDEIVITFPQEISTAVQNSVQDIDNNTGATTVSGTQRSGVNNVLGNVVKGVVGGVVSNAINGTLESSVNNLLTSFQSGDVNQIYQSITGFLGAQAPQNFEAFLSSITGLVMSKSSIGEGLSRISQDIASLNSVGNASIVENFADAGRAPIGNSGLQYDSKNKVYSRGKNVVSNNNRSFQFSSGTKITRMIEEVVLTSDWAKQLRQRSPDENGMIDWFKIESQTFVKQDPAQELQDGQTAKTYHYRVVPYKVHSNTLQQPTDPGLNYDNLKKAALREYNYIYTGENTEIINFDININAAFFSATMPDRGQNNIDYKSGGSQNRLIQQDPESETNKNPANAISSTGHILQVENISTSTQGGGGAGIDNNKIRTARLFHDTIINSNVDLVSLELEIHGDPYFMFDSGLGNYTAGTLDTNQTADGTMEYQRSEVDVIVNFRTPVDYNENSGGMHFPEDTIPVDAFSGLYRVTTLTNRIRDNKFTQTLQLLRRRNQDGNDVTVEQPTKVTDAPEDEQSHSPYPGSASSSPSIDIGQIFGQLIDAALEEALQDEGATTESETGTANSDNVTSAAPETSPRPRARPDQTTSAAQRRIDAGGTAFSDSSAIRPTQRGGTGAAASGRRGDGTRGT